MHNTIKTNATISTSRFEVIIGHKCIKIIHINILTFRPVYFLQEFISFYSRSTCSRLNPLHYCLVFIILCLLFVAIFIDSFLIRVLFPYITLFHINYIVFHILFSCFIFFICTRHTISSALVTKFEV